MLNSLLRVNGGEQRKFAANYSREFPDAVWERIDSRDPSTPPPSPFPSQAPGQGPLGVRKEGVGGLDGTAEAVP